MDPPDFTDEDLDVKFPKVGTPAQSEGLGSGVFRHFYRGSSVFMIFPGPRRGATPAARATSSQDRRASTSRSN